MKKKKDEIQFPQKLELVKNMSVARLNRLTAEKVMGWEERNPLERDDYYVRPTTKHGKQTYIMNVDDWNPCKKPDQATLLCDKVLRDLNAELDGQTIMTVSFRKKEYNVMFFMQGCTDDGIGQGNTLQLAMTRCAASVWWRKQSTLAEQARDGPCLLWGE